MRGVIASAIIVSVLAVGCSNLAISSDYEPTFAFSGLADWAWADRQPPNDGDAKIPDPLLDARIERAIAEALVAKGLPQSDRESADFLVTYHVTFDKALEVSEVPASYGYWGYWGGFYGSRTVVDQYQQRTLLIDVVDPATNALLWRGTAVERMRNFSTPEQREKNVRAVVDAVLKRFPPR